MLAEELRIGNLVYNSHGDIHAIGCNCFHRFRYPSMDGNPSGFKPIPLSEEILLKCGFELNKEKTLFEHSKCRLKMMDIVGLYYRANFPIRADITSLHQLQNLFYALAGEELEVKL